MSECDNSCAQAEFQKFVFMTEQNNLVLMEMGELAVTHQVFGVFFVIS